MIIYLRFQLHMSFSYFQSCVLAMKTSSANNDTLTEVDRVGFLLGGDKHEFFMEKSEESRCVAGPAPQIPAVRTQDCSFICD